MTFRVGRTELILGPMFSGKTTELFRRVRRAVFSGANVCVIKWSHDGRSKRKYMTASHNGENMLCLVVDSLVSDPVGLPDNVDFIAVDEGQFITGLEEFCIRQNKMGRTVVVSALTHKADAKRSRWPIIESLEGWAFCQHFTAICSLCKGEATCSRMLGGTHEHLDGVNIGGAEAYIAVCSACYTEPISPEHIESHRRAIDTIRKLRLSQD